MAVWCCSLFHVEWGQGSHNVRSSPLGVEAAQGPGQECVGGTLGRGFGMSRARTGLGAQGR